MRKLLLLVAGALFLALSGCTHIAGAGRLGGTEAKIWVFLRSSDQYKSDIYRCVDPGNGTRPVCTRVTWK